MYASSKTEIAITKSSRRHRGLSSVEMSSACASSRATCCEEQIQKRQKKKCKNTNLWSEPPAVGKCGAGIAGLLRRAKSHQRNRALANGPIDANGGHGHSPLV